MSIIKSIRNNPGMTLGGIFLLVAIVVLIGWLVNRGKMGGKFGPGSTSDGPQLEISGTKTVSSVNTSGYEYAGQAIGSNIDIKLNINTKSGFQDNGIIKLVVVRKYGDKTIDTSDQIDVKDYKSYNIVFKGSDLQEDAVSSSGGDNVFDVFGILKDGSRYNNNKSIISGTVNISADDLNYVLDTSMESQFNFTPVTSPFSSEKFSSRTPYYLSFEPDRKVYILPTSDNKKYKFQYADNKTFMTESGINEWSLDKLGERYRFYSGDKILTILNGSFQLVKPGEMNSRQARNSLVKISDQPQTDPFPKDISGLVGRYTVDSATATAWNDVSGADNHATDVIGSLKVDDIDFIYGTKDDGIKFPQNFSGGYTLFYVANYNGSNRGRIFDGYPENWLSGFHSGNIGVAYHTNQWLTHDTAPAINTLDGWIMGSDSKGMYRANGMDVNSLDLTAYPPNNPTTISINHGLGREWGSELSDWAVKEVILYDRELSLDEVKKVEAYLSSAYGINKGDGVTPGMVDNGYFKIGATNNKAENLSGVSVDRCREAAKTAGVHGFGYRKMSHPADDFKGSCFLFGKMYDDNGNRDTTWAWTWDKDHSFHCTDPKGIVQDACQVPN